MKKLILAIVLVAALYFGLGQTGALRQLIATPPTQAQAVPAGRTDELRAAFAEQRSGTQVTGEGVEL